MLFLRVAVRCCLLFVWCLFVLYCGSLPFAVVCFGVVGCCLLLIVVVWCCFLVCVGVCRGVSFGVLCCCLMKLGVVWCCLLLFGVVRCLLLFAVVC